MTEWLVVALSLPVSAVLTWAIRMYAVKRGLLDVPNHRSSHESPTPRGGGLAIVLTFLAASVYFFVIDAMSSSFFLALSLGGILVAGIGFLDDHVNVSIRWRLLAHFAAVSFAVFFIGGLPPVQLGGVLYQSGWWGYGVAIVLVVWVLNFYNFMDGIDGIAGVEAICLAGGAALIIWWHAQSPVYLILFSLAASVLGFLYWNWPRARIFLGDSGSGFLGFVLGVMVLYTAGRGMIPIWSWIILFGVFTTDATITLVRRMVSGQRWYMAHRSHAYQRLARKWDSHARVTLAVLAVNVVWLFPLAFWSASYPSLAFIFTLLAHTPLIIMVILTGAGKSDP